MELIKLQIEAKAAAHADAGYLVSMADARCFVLEICREAGVRRPPPDSLEKLASDLVRCTLEAQKGRASRFPLNRAG